MNNWRYPQYLPALGPPQPALLRRWAKACAAALALGVRGARAGAVAGWRPRRRAGVGTAEAARVLEASETGKIAADGARIAG